MFYKAIFFVKKCMIVQYKLGVFIDDMILK